MTMGEKRRAFMERHVKIEQVKSALDYARARREFDAGRYSSAAVWQKISANNSLLVRTKLEHLLDHIVLHRERFEK